MEIKRELMRKEYLLLLFCLILFLILNSIVNATITIVSPRNNTNWSSTAVFNVSYTNTTDFTDALNATFYYNLSGTWQLIGSALACVKSATIASCNATLNIASLTDGRYSINATLSNGTQFGDSYGASIITTNVVFDERAPNITIIYPSNNTNFSSTSFNVNYTVADSLAGVAFCWYSNSSGAANYTLASCTNITGKNWLSGINNVTIWVNDSAGNINSSFVSFFVDNVKPNLTIIYPTNNTNTSNTQLNVNYTVADSRGISTCWYSNTSGTINYTLTSCANITGRTWLSGINNVTIWVNDTVGNLNSSFVSFFVDTINPNLTIIYPQNNTNTSNTQLNINYTVGDNRGISTCWYANATGATAFNYTLTSCANITGKNWLSGINNVTIWVNDSAGNINSSFVSFFVDNVKPNINITFPQNNTNSTSRNLNVNYTINDNRGIGGCWYSNDTYLANTTLDNCINITTVTWSLGSHEVTVWVNDTVGNINYSRVNFNISQSDITAPTATFSCSPSTINRGNVVTCNCEPIDSESGVNTSATVYETSPPTNQIGTLTVYCYFADLAGNVGSVSTTYFVFDQGGAGLLKPKSIPSTVSTEILKKIESWEKITPDAPEIMKDFDKDMGVKQIQIEVIDEAQNVQMSVTSYGSKPTNLSVSKDETYKYLHIETQNLTDKLSKAVMDIQVEKLWISENNLNKENVALFKFNETSNQWKELKTTFKEEDDIYNYYNIELKSFSYFAIASKEIKRGILSILIWIIFAIVILAGIVFFSITNKNKIKKFLKIK